MDEEDNGWVFDSLVCFLNGPVWSAPLESFIEEKSLIFESNVPESPEYRKIFEEFKNLVDFMLGNFMEDIGITPQQFEDACAKGTQGGVSLHFEQNIFEQIWAANDYEMFKRMMSQRNVELQLQALELIERKYGITPESFVPHKEKQDEESKRSGQTKAEITPRPSSALEKEIMKEVVKKFPQPDVKDEEDSLQVQYLLEEKKILEDSLKKTTENSPRLKFKITESSSSIRNPEENLKPLVNEIKLEVKTSPTKENAMKPSKEVVPEPKPSGEVDRVELKKRQEYLRAQRDKLVALKKEARKKQLQVEDAGPDKFKVRPKSAKKAAESILEGNVANIEPQQLQIRKALVEKLKSEVIGSKNEN